MPVPPRRLPAPPPPSVESTGLEPAPGRRSHRRLIVGAVLALILAIAAFAGWRLFFAVPPVPPGVVAVSGRIEGDEAAVSPKTSGRIREVTVREGDSVEAGAVIAILDDEQVRAREQQAEAAVRQAEARLATAEAQLAQAEASYAQARWDRDAFATLFQRGLIAEQQARQAENNERTQAAMIVAAKRQVGAAQAEADRARAQLEEARANRQDLRVVAPFAGTVTTRTAEPGEVVTAGTPVIMLVDLGRVYLRAFVPEGQIGRVRLGQPARVYLDSAPTQPIEAFVSRVDPQATFTPENTYFREERVKQVVGVKLQLRGAEGFAKPGMPADGEILVEGTEWPAGRTRR
ncbi:MAG TPA: efflux RND transporter periplasmic adaptor subunit [Methylomirabilota bacterium]|jgi:HlyD family secretion protein